MKGYCGKCNKNSNYHIVKKEVNEFEGIKLNNCFENIAICDKCGGRIYVEDLEKENRKNILTAYRNATNSVSPEEIENFRKKYSISQRELSAILGYAKMTINRYERGAIPDKSHNEYLKIIISNEKEFFKIVEQAYQLARITEKTYKKIINIGRETYMIKKVAKINVNNELLAETTESLKELLKNNLIRIVLYGSYARGDYNDSSDIDIFILVSNKKENLNKVLDLILDKLYELDLKYNVTINPLIENTKIYDEYKDSSLLFENIEKEGVVLYG